MSTEWLEFGKYGKCRVLCKFFMHGACLKGEDCMFSHSWSDQASQVSKEHRLSSNKLHASKCFLSGKRLCSAFSLCMALFFPSIRTLFFQWSCHVCVLIVVWSCAGMHILSAWPLFLWQSLQVWACKTVPSSVK